MASEGKERAKLRRAASSPMVRCDSGARPPVGFSLIEVLVVLAIVGVLVLAVGIGVASVGGERRLEREAERFQALVVHACTQAELGGRSIGLRVDAARYAFMTLGIEGWREGRGEGELRAREWMQGMHVTLARDGRELRTAADDAAAPQLVCFPSGELTPFHLTLSLGEGLAAIDVVGHADGRVELARREARQ